MQIAERLEFISQDTNKSLQPDLKERVGKPNNLITYLDTQTL
jgi:hypothetical protein